MTPSAILPASHPLRTALSQEMHARKLPRLAAPARVFQFVLLVTGGEATRNEEQLRRRVEDVPSRFHAGGRYLTCELPDLLFAWERHSEFMTYTFIVGDVGAPLFDLSPLGRIEPWIGDVAGTVVRSSHIVLLRDEPDATEIAASFSADDLVISDVIGGAARIWCDFRLHPDGFGRLLVVDRGMAGAEASQLVQRLQELGNYRKMALLGLPAARDATPALSALESRLAEVTARISLPDTDDQMLLGALSTLSAELAQIIAATGYRMGATRAYADICADRLRNLAVQPVRGYVSFDDFTERRLLPATRTCDAFAGRLNALSARAEWTSALLRTRIDTALARQNRDLLASMDRRTELQLRLQHTVEGLSVVAVSYYATGLWHYLREALRPAGIAVAEWADVIVILAIVLTTWGLIRGMKRRAHDPGA